MSFLPSRPLAPLLACGLLALAPLATRASQLIANLELGRPQKIVAYGTSLTEGGQWVADTAHWLGTQYPGLVTVINSGLSGKASNTALANLQAKVVAHAPDTVIIEFAMNDAFTAYAATDPDYGITVAKSQANLNQMIDAILAAKPGAEIILQTMNPPWDAPNGNQSATKRANLAAYYEGYRQVAAARGLLLVDHHANWMRLRADNLAQFQAYLPDGVHPTAVGSSAVTFPELKKALLMTPVRTAPTGVVATSGDGRIALAWNGVIGASGYTVKRADNRAGPYATVATGVTARSHTDARLSNGTVYWYAVAATDAAGEGPASSPVFAKPFPPVVITQDNTDATGVTFTGVWQSSALAGFYGTNSVYAAASSAATARFTPAIAVPGTYAVHARWTASSNRATNARFTLAHADGSVVVSQNQRFNNGEWMPLGVFRFAAGTGGKVTLDAAGSDGVVIADAVRFTLQADPAITMGDWRAARFTAAELGDSAIGGDLADPDGDGRPNLLEYALGTDPRTADNPAPAVTLADNHLTLTFPRRQTAADLNYVPEVAGAPAGSWSSGPAAIEQTIVADRGDGFSLVRARDLTALGTGAGRFLRLRVSLP